MASSQELLLPPPTEINNAHKVYSIAVWCIVLAFVSSLCVSWRLGLRIYARAFGADDYAIIPALVRLLLASVGKKGYLLTIDYKLLYIGWTAMAAYVNLHAGVGKPLWEITVGEYSIWFKGIVGSAWLYPTMTCSIRISVLLFYRRIFTTPQSRTKYVIWLLLALQSVYLVVFSVLPAFICRPLHMAWHPLERQRYFNDWYYYYTQVALFSTSMAFDAVLLVLPIYPVFKLHLPLRTRMGVAVLFMLSAAASIAAAYKLAVFVVEMKRYTHINPLWLRYQLSLLIPPQFDTYGRTFWIPSQVEPTVALIGTSLPALRQSLIAATKQVSKIWSNRSVSFRLSSTFLKSVRSRASAGGVRKSGVGAAGVVKFSSPPLHKSQSSSASNTALHTEYYEFDEGAKKGTVSA